MCVVIRAASLPARSGRADRLRGQPNKTATIPDCGPKATAAMDLMDLVDLVDLVDSMDSMDLVDLMDPRDTKPRFYHSESLNTA